MPRVLTGVPLGLSATDPSLDLEIHRATDALGTGDTIIAKVSGTRTLYVDPLPIDGVTRYYAAKHVGENMTSSSLSPWVAGTPREIQPGDAPPPMTEGRKRTYAGFDTGGNVQSGILPGVGVLEGASTFKLYRHREDITILGADTDGDVAYTFAQTYQNVPMIAFRGGQFVTFSNTIGTAVKQRTRIQVLNATASGFTSRSQICSVGATTAQANDFASGNSVTTVGGTAALSLNPGGANDNNYTVNYYVQVIVDANASNFCTATVTIAIDSNDGTTGWQERATFSYSASPLSGPPPYSAATSTFATESKIITVSGLTLAAGAQIRVRVKSFTVTAGGTGSFTLRGADGAGANPETARGVTYTTAADTTESAIPSNGDQVQWSAQEVA